MWDHESQRIGKRKCTALGYACHCTADVLGFVSLLLLLGSAAYFVYEVFVGNFRAGLPYLFLITALVLGLIGELLFAISWKLADRRGFRYDPEAREASWMEKGHRVSYKWQPHQTLNRTTLKDSKTSR